MIKDLIHKLELSLLEPTLRHSAEHLNRMLADEFIEFGSSGRIYTKKDMLEHLPLEASKIFIVEDFKILELSDKVILATYKATIDDQCSIRSSIWKLYGDVWQMVFHQGTKY